MKLIRISRTAALLLLILLLGLTCITVPGQAADADSISFAEDRRYKVKSEFAESPVTFEA